MKLYKEKYAKLIIGNIHARFPVDILSVLGSFSIFNVENIPSSSDSEEIITKMMKILLGINGIIFALK